MNNFDGTDPYLVIKILEGYLKAVLSLPISNGETVDDLLNKEDNKLYYNIHCNLNIPVKGE